MKLKFNIKLSPQLRFYNTRFMFRTKREAYKCTEFIWLTLPPIVDFDGDLRNPKVAIIINLN